MNNKIKKVTVSISSVPYREDGLKASVESLIDQVDCMNIYLNNYQSVPLFLKNTKIKFFRSQDYRDLGDIGKFYFSKDMKGYHFTCDDDIIYPPDYIAFMISKLGIHNGFISCHGAIFHSPFDSFYKTKTTFHFRKEIKNDISVNLVGTGVMAYDADKIKIPFNIFKNKNMADVYIAIFAKKKNIKCTVVAHKEFFLKDYYKEKLSENNFIQLFQKIRNRLMLDNIYRLYKNNHTIQTDLINKNGPWALGNGKKLDFVCFKYYTVNNKNRIYKDSIKMYGIFNDHIFKAINNNKIFYENDLLFHLFSKLSFKENSIAVDVGANIGNHSIFFGKYLCSEVLSFEPSAINYNILNMNLDFNLDENKFKTYQMALGNITGEVELTYPNNDNWGGLAKISDNTKKGYEVIEKVKITTLDKILTEEKKHNNINLIKIDVEGLEIDVLKGAENIISQNLPHIVVEAHNQDKLLEIKQYLGKFNYSILGKFCKTPTYHFITKNHRKQLCNFLFTKNISHLLNKISRHKNKYETYLNNRKI